MNILITGSNGFIGRNLIENLKNIRDGKNRSVNLMIDIIYEYNTDSSPEVLDEYCKNADFVFNLAGVNRPINSDEFYTGNCGFLGDLLSMLKKHNNTCPVMLSSSIQAELDNDYGRSKREAEKLLFEYSKETGSKALIYRFPNVFGKWCKPNYNSVVATFCYNIANGLPIVINNRDTVLTLVYIDDVVDELINALCEQETRVNDYCEVCIKHTVTLGEIADKLYKFNAYNDTLMMPELPEGSFDKKLYSTFLSYLPYEKTVIDLKSNVDERGSFTEIMHTLKSGQFSVNVSKPGITKGQHWHNSKWELFIVVSGRALIQQRKIGSDEVIDFEVSSDNLKAVYMLPGYTHNIINLSDTENLVTLMWANENFNSDSPDTYFEEVENTDV